MTKMPSYSSISLIPTQQTGGGTPFVSPTFEMAFRKCEQLFWEGDKLYHEVKRLEGQLNAHELTKQWLGPNIEFCEQWLKLRHLHKELIGAQPILEREIAEMSRALDPRYGRCIDVDCEQRWLTDGIKVNVLKSRTFLHHLTKLVANLKNLLDETEQTMSEARLILTQAFDNYSHDASRPAIDLGLPNLG
jgi:hypothetical protein